MFELPTHAKHLLNNAIHHMAETCESGEEFDQNLERLTTLKALTGSDRLRQAIRETSESSSDRLRREKDVMTTLSEVQYVKEMM